jgi:starvation-inducible DNA-binding protein
MLAELREDNGEVAKRMREAHEMIDEQRDVATASVLEVLWRDIWGVIVSDPKLAD